MCYLFYVIDDEINLKKIYTGVCVVSLLSNIFSFDKFWNVWFILDNTLFAKYLHFLFGLVHLGEYKIYFEKRYPYFVINMPSSNNYNKKTTSNKIQWNKKAKWLNRQHIPAHKGLKTYKTKFNKYICNITADPWNIV